MSDESKIDNAEGLPACDACAEKVCTGASWTAHTCGKAPAVQQAPADWTPPADGAQCFEAALDEGSPEETCLHCGKHIRRHYGGTEYRCEPREAAQQAPVLGAAPVTEEDRRILRPLLAESRTLSEHGVEVLRPYEARGYVRLSRALCLGAPTGETMASLTEAGRFILAEEHRQEPGSKGCVKCGARPEEIDAGMDCRPRPAAPPAPGEGLTLERYVRTACQVGISDLTDEAAAGSRAAAAAEDRAVERTAALLTPAARVQLALDALRGVPTYSDHEVVLRMPGRDALDLLLGCGGAPEVQLRLRDWQGRDATVAYDQVHLRRGAVHVWAQGPERPATAEEVATLTATGKAA